MRRCLELPRRLQSAIELRYGVAMPGYTKKQLTSRSANLSNYVWCKICRLYWHRRAFQKHLRPEVPVKRRQIAVMHPAMKGFIDFLAEMLLKEILEERAERARRGEPIEKGFLATEATVDDDEPELVTVEEAALRLGVSREQILAEFGPEPFRVELR